MEAARPGHRWRSERHDCDRDQRTSKRDHRREKIERSIDGRGDHVFFEEELGPIDERLQETERSYAAGPPAILNSAHQLALEEHRIGDAHQQHHRYDDDLQQAPEKKLENRHEPSAFQSATATAGAAFWCRSSSSNAGL